MADERRKAIARTLTRLMPRMPFSDAEAIREAARAPHLRALGAEQAFWLAAIAHIRHRHTEYDALRDEGYARDEARFFVLEDVNAVLDRWGSHRLLQSLPEAEHVPADEDDTTR